MELKREFDREAFDCLAAAIQQGAVTPESQTGQYNEITGSKYETWRARIGEQELLLLKVLGLGGLHWERIYNLEPGKGAKKLAAWHMDKPDQIDVGGTPEGQQTAVQKLQACLAAIPQ